MGEDSTNTCTVLLYTAVSIAKSSHQVLIRIREKKRPACVIKQTVAENQH